MRRIEAILVAATLLLGGATASAQELPPEPPDRAQDTAARGEAYYHLMRATFAVRSGNVRAAMTEIRRAMELRPDSPDLQAESASLMWAIGRRSEAEKLARGALRLDPEQPTALRVLAELATFRALSRGGDEKSRDEAIRFYEQLARDPDVDDETLRILANLRMQAGDRVGAIDTTRRLSTKRPGDPRVARMLAQMLREEGRAGDALEVLLEHLARYGADRSIIEQVSELGRETERWDMVEAAVAERLERQDSTTLRVLRGEALLHLARFDDAVEALERGRDDGAADPVLLFHLYTAYDALGRLADAAEVAQELVSLLPDNPGALTVLGQALARQRQLEPAVEALREALAGFGGEASAGERRDRIRWRLAELYLEQGSVDEASAVLAGLEEPDRPEGLELLFRAALARGEPEAARRPLAALRTQRKHGLAALLEGELLARTGKTGRARTRFREAVVALGNATWAPVGEIWLEAGRAEEGERGVRTWVAAEPDSANARFALGSFLERQGRFDEAEQELERSIALDPRHANALNYLGYSLADRNRQLERALELIQRALDIDPWNGAYLDSLGWVYYRMGRFADALGPLERAARELPSDPTVLEHLGDVYRQLGRTDAALATWDRALRASPDDPEAIRSKIEALRTAARSSRLRLPGDPGPR